MDNSQICSVHYTDDVELLFAGVAGEGWEFEALQLSPGPLGSRVCTVQLPDLCIYWSRLSASLHMRESHRHDAVYLTFLLDASGPGKWYGRNVAFDQAVLFHPHREQDYMLPRESDALGFMIDRQLARRMGWHFRQSALQNVDQRSMRQIATRASAVTRAVQAGEVQSDEDFQILQERLAMCLGPLLGPWITEDASADPAEFSPARQYQLVDRARRLMLELDFSRKLDMTWFARRLCVSSRSLYRAFRNCLGVGPYEYFTVLRLQALRCRMRRTAFEPGAITSVATSFGFSNLGRFAGLYRRHFGELPRDTLRRWGDELSFRPAQGYRHIIGTHPVVSPD